MIDGDVDKITGIFFARNNFGYLNEDIEPKKTEVNVHLSMQELIDGAKNLTMASPKQIAEDKSVPLAHLREQEPAHRKKRKTAPSLNEEIPLDLVQK